MFGLAVVIVSFVFGLSFTFLGELPRSLSDLLMLAAFVSLFAWLPITTVGLFVAIPLAVLMKKAKVTGAAAWGGVGAITGGLASVGYAIIEAGRIPGTATLEGTLAVAAIGMPPGMVAGLFWWFGVIRREQKMRIAERKSTSAAQDPNNPPLAGATDG